MCVRNITLEWVNKAEEDAAVAERESRVRKRPSPGAVCYHAQQCIEKYLKAVLQEMERQVRPLGFSLGIFSHPHTQPFRIQRVAR